MIQRHLKFQLAREISFADFPGSGLRPTHCFSLCQLPLPLHIHAITSKRLKQCKKHLHHTRPKPKSNRVGQLI